ncbi:hypothetical protein [Aquabacterium sp.]|uniref:hypothetical protein n=1 Tax=Aquabacterium sp. TaxID=1872578 RepID=UPI0040384392
MSYTTETVHETVYVDDCYECGWGWTLWEFLSWFVIIALLVGLLSSCTRRVMAVAAPAPAVAQVAPVVPAPVVAPAVVHAAPPVVVHTAPVMPLVVPHFGYSYPAYRSGMVVRRTTVTRTYGGFRRGR